MKKFIKAVVCVGVLFSISACGGKGSDDIAKDVSSKIDKAEWEIEHDPEAGTAVDYLNLIINDDVSFALTLYKDNNKIESIAYSNSAIGTYDEETLGYNTESEENDSYVAHDGDAICIYDIVKKEVQEGVSSASSCKRDANKNIKPLQKARDKALEKANISLDDLYAWGEWYHEQND